MWKWLLMAVPSIVFAAEFSRLAYSRRQLVCVVLLFACALLGATAVRRVTRHPALCLQDRLKSAAIAASISCAGALAVFVLANNLNLGSITASGIVGILSARLLPARQGSIAYTGVFVGMSSPLIIGGLGAVAAAGLVAGVIYELLDGVLDGVGGRLGTMAAAAVVVVLLAAGRGGW